MKKPKPLTMYGFKHIENNTISPDMFETKTQAKIYLSGCLSEARRAFKVVKLKVTEQ